MKDKLRFPVLLTLIRLLPMSIVRKILLKQISGNTRVSGEWAEFEKAYYNELAGNLSKETLIRFMKNGIDEKRRFIYKPERVASWKGRCLIISSKDDSLSFDKVDMLKARFPGSTTQIFEQGGHHTITFFPGMYAEAVKKFLDKNI